MGHCLFESIALVSNIATIMGFLIALHLWVNWKKQQNYSFNRDKIFEAEIAVSKAYTSLMNYMQLTYEQQLRKLEKSMVVDQNSHQALLEKTVIDIKENLNNYDLAVHTLSVLNVKYTKEILINKHFLNNQFMSYCEQMHYKKTSKDLIQYYWNDVLPEMQSKRSLATKHLADLRIEI